MSEERTAASRTSAARGLLRMAGIAIATLAVGADAFAWCNISATSCNLNWSHRKKLLLNSNEAGILANFPVQVVLTPARPTVESLTESLVKAEGRGAIAGLSPSGLSLDGPAHQYHRALMAELTSGRHERLGDALAAAQRTYAETGLMPELLGIYHLFGDPALRLR